MREPFGLGRRRAPCALLVGVVCFAVATLVPRTGTAEIIVDAVTAIDDNTSVFTWSHTVGVGPKPALVVGVSIYKANKTVQSVTFAGVPLTRAGFTNGGSGATDRRVEIWYVAGPPVGTDDIVVTMDGGSKNAIGAVSLFGVDPTSPVGGYVSGQGNDAQPSIGVPSAPGEMVLDVLSVKGNAITATVGPQQVERWNRAGRTNGGQILGAGSTEPGAPGAAMSWTLSEPRYWVIGAITLRPYVPPPLQPDAMVKLPPEADSQFLSDDLYESPAVTQVKSQGVVNGTPATYVVRFQNDGGLDDAFVITGTGSGGGFNVAYIDATGADRTAAVTAGGYTESSLAFGEFVDWTVRVTADPATGGGASRAVSIDARSTGDATLVDQVMAITTSVSPQLSLSKTADKTEAAPNEDIVYTVVANTAAGLSDATSIVVVDSIPDNTGFRVGSASFDPGTTAMTAAVSYSNDDGSSWSYVPGDGGCVAPSGYDYCVTHVRWVVSGTMPAAQNFALSFAVRVK